MALLNPTGITVVGNPTPAGPAFLPANPVTGADGGPRKPGKIKGKVGKIVTVEGDEIPAPREVGGGPNIAPPPHEGIPIPGGSPLKVGLPQAN